MRWPCSDRAVVVQAIATCRAVRQTRGLLERFASCPRQRRLGGVALAAASSAVSQGRQMEHFAPKQPNHTMISRTTRAADEASRPRARPRSRPRARRPTQTKPLPARPPALGRLPTCPPGRAPPRAAGGGGGSQVWGRRPQPGEGGGGDGRAEASPCPRSEEAGGGRKSRPAAPFSPPGSRLAPSFPRRLPPIPPPGGSKGGKIQPHGARLSICAETSISRATAIQDMVSICL